MNNLEILAKEFGIWHADRTMNDPTIDKNYPWAEIDDTLVDDAFGGDPSMNADNLSGDEESIITSSINFATAACEATANHMMEAIQSLEEELDKKHMKWLVGGVLIGSVTVVAVDCIIKTFRRKKR